jgi:HAMP domain-containing protein
MKKKNSGAINWWIDCILFVSFLVMFFLELTGVVLHQWLGMLAGIWALYHLVRHWGWLRAVGQHFFAKASLKALLYTLLDAALLLGFSIILMSGLIISTWLDLPLQQTGQTWVTLHVTASEVTLGLVVLKVLVHGCWVIAMARRIFRPATPLQAQPATGGVTRREFLRMAGLVCGAAGLAMLAVTRPLNGLSEVAAEDAAAEPTDRPAQPDTTPIVAQQAQLEPTAQTAQPTAVATPTATTVPAVTCQHCPKGRHCAYPGSCRLYTDANGNGLCDLGECA